MRVKPKDILNQFIFYLLVFLNLENILLLGEPVKLQPGPKQQKVSE